MKIQNEKDVKSVNERFNHFHDGFIKSISFISGHEFVTELPGEKKRTFETNEAELLQTSLLYGDETIVEILICHNNYDWPNQPKNRAISIRTNDVAEIADNLSKFAGQEIFDFYFEIQKAGTSCVLIYYENDSNCHNRTIENGIKIVLLSAKSFEVEEALWIKT
jgi:hypothetical protein